MQNETFQQAKFIKDEIARYQGVVADFSKQASKWKSTHSISLVEDHDDYYTLSGVYIPDEFLQNFCISIVTHLEGKIKELENEFTNL